MSKKRFHKKPLALAVGLLLTAQVQANTIIVDTDCSIIDAIKSANTDTATGLCAAGSGADTIELPENSTFTLIKKDNNTFMSGSYAQSIGGNGLPVIDSDITISGNNSIIERSATLATEYFRIALIANGGHLTLKDTTITGGRLISNIGQSYGGGLAIIRNSSLTLINSTVSNNSTASSTVDGDGGGVFSEQGCTLNVIDSTISGNSSGSYGGGIAARGYTTNITNSTISGNYAFKNGGAIYTGYSGALVITHSTISNNKAGSTYSGRDLGNGISSVYGSNVHLNSSILSNGGSECGVRAGGFNTDQGNNWVSDFTCTGTAGAGSINLDALAANGGATLTHALLVGSAAIDALPVGACSQGFDQRGISRPQGTACDIGAFELQAATPPDDEDIADIIQFFEDGLEDGTLQGFSASYSPNGNQKASDRAETAFSNQLKALASFIDDGNKDAACAQLESILKRIHTSGPLFPKYFVTGTDAVELANKLKDLQTELGC